MTTEQLERWLEWLDMDIEDPKWGTQYHNTTWEEAHDALRKRYREFSEDIYDCSLYDAMPPQPVLESSMMVIAKNIARLNLEGIRLMHKLGVNPIEATEKSMQELMEYSKIDKK